MDPITAACSAIAVATAFKDIIELCLRLKLSLKKVGKNRKKLLQIADDIKLGLSEFETFCTGREVDNDGSPELKSALDEIRTNMVSVVLRCEALLKEANQNKFAKWVQDWLKQRDLEEEMVELKEKISNYHTHFITWSSIRNELRLERLLAHSMDQQLKMNILIQHTLPHTPQPHAFVSHIHEITVNPITRNAIEDENLSFQIDEILERIPQAFSALEETAYLSRTTLSGSGLEIVTYPRSTATLRRDLTIEVLSFAQTLETDPKSVQDPIYTLRLISSKLKRAQRYKQSLALDIQIVALSHRLVARDPLTFLPRLSPHLVELAISHLSLGKHEEASQACNYALTTLSRLRASFPALDLRQNTANVFAILAQSSLALNHTNDALAHIGGSLKIYKDLLGEIEKRNGPSVLQGETNISTTLNAYQALLGYVDILIRRAQYADCFFKMEQAWCLLLRITPEDLIRHRGDLRSELPLQVARRIYEDEPFSLSRFEKLVVSHAKLAEAHPQVFSDDFLQLLMAFNYAGLVIEKSSQPTLSPDTLSVLNSILSHDATMLFNPRSGPIAILDSVLPIRRSVDAELIARAAFRCFLFWDEKQLYIRGHIYRMVDNLTRVFSKVAEEETQNHIKILGRVWKENDRSISHISAIIHFLLNLEPPTAAETPMLALLNELVEFCCVHRPVQDGKQPGIMWVMEVYPTPMVDEAGGWWKSWTTAIHQTTVEITRDLEMDINAKWHRDALDCVWARCSTSKQFDLAIEFSLGYFKLVGQHLKQGLQNFWIAEPYLNMLCRYVNVVQSYHLHPEARRLMDNAINPFVKGNRWSGTLVDRFASCLVQTNHYHEALAVISSPPRTTPFPATSNANLTILQLIALYALDADQRLTHHIGMVLRSKDDSFWTNGDYCMRLFLHMSAYHHRAGRCHIALEALNLILDRCPDLPGNSHDLSYGLDTNLPSVLIIRSQIQWRLRRLDDALDSSREAVQRQRVHYQTRPWIASTLLDMMEILRSQLTGVGQVEAAEEFREEAERIREEWARYCESPERQSIIATVKTIMETTHELFTTWFPVPNLESQWDERLSAWKDHIPGHAVRLGRDVIGSSGPFNTGSPVLGRGGVEESRQNGELDQLSERHAQREERPAGSEKIGASEQAELEDMLFLHSHLFARWYAIKADSTSDCSSIADSEDDVAGDATDSLDSPGTEPDRSSFKAVSEFPNGPNIHDDLLSDVDLPSVRLHGGDEAWSEAEVHSPTYVPPSSPANESSSFPVLNAHRGDIGRPATPLTSTNSGVSDAPRSESLIGHHDNPPYVHLDARDDSSHPVTPSTTTPCETKPISPTILARPPLRLLTLTPHILCFSIIVIVAAFLVVQWFSTFSYQ